VGLWIGPGALRRPSPVFDPRLPPHQRAGHPVRLARVAPPKADRIVVGLLAGTALFYLLGKALGLGRN
jgi:hypothetical protein